MGLLGVSVFCCFVFLYRTRSRLMKLRRTKSRLQDSLHTLHTVYGSKAKIVCGIENDRKNGQYIPNRTRKRKEDL